MRKAVILLITLFTVLSSQAQDVQSFVSRQLQTYPKSRLLDLYKSCFQDFMGAEHLVVDHQRIKAYLDEELNSVTLDDLMPWIYEPCGIDSSYYRVSIRAVKEGLISEDMLLDAFICSANSSNRPSVDEWNERWHKMIGTIDGMQLNLPQYNKDRQFIDSVLSVGKYAISHSPEYREAYRPHYRIVERSIFEQEILPLIEQKTMIVRIAEIEVYPEYLKDYLKAARNVGSESVRKEPGVICIFPNQVRADETKIRIVEIYRNKEAYQHHLTTPHFQAYKQGTLHMVKSLNLLDIQPLTPDAMQQIFIKLQ
jgi:quinol monooxygenase YgiN